MTKYLFLFTVIVGIGFISCQSDDNASLNSNELGYQEQITLANDLTLQFFEISDSRCPANVQCIWQGVAQVTLRVTEQGQLIDDIVLCDWDTNGVIEGCENARVIGEYMVTLLEVNPYPQDANNLPEPEDYTIVLQIERI